MSPINGYVLGAELGRGGMGTVYAAQQPSLERTVAVKMLHTELAQDPAILERFRTEAIAGSRLSHPNIASVFDFGTTTGGTPYLVMEYVAGERLAAIVDRDGTVPARRACAIVGQILAALEAAHAAGIVHADVKSDNVLIDTRDVATLIDFGIARIDDTAPETTAKVLSGTPDYMAPEVIRGLAPTIASDLYAVGIVLYELLTGETPFSGGTAAEVFRRHLDEEAIAPSLRCPTAQISPSLDRVVLHALAKDPAARPASAAELAAELLAAAVATATTAPGEAPRSHASSTEAPTQDWPLSQRRRLARGSRPQPNNRAEQLRTAIGEAIANGDCEAIASTYLELARALVASGHADVATWELEQAIDVLTAGEGPRASVPPPSLWRVLLALASIHDGTGDAARAESAARDARLAAIHTHSACGRDRARALLQRLRASPPCSARRP